MSAPSFGGGFDGVNSEPSGSIFQNVRHFGSRLKGSKDLEKLNPTGEFSAQSEGGVKKSHRLGFGSCSHLRKHTKLENLPVAIKCTKNELKIIKCAEYI